MATLDLFQRLSITEQYGDLEKPDLLTRYAGGHRRKNYPFVSGYWQFMVWTPEVIFGSDRLEAEAWLHACAEGFTPHSRTFNKTDIPGQGGIGASFITGQTITRTFTITFREYQNLPISRVLRKWSAIDPYIGVSPIPGEDWTANNYKGAALIMLTKPTGGNRGGSMTENDIEEVYYYTGVFPEIDGTDTLAADIAANDSIVHNISFSFDGFPLTRDEIDVGAALETLIQNNYYNATYLSTYANNAKVPSGFDLK